MCVSFCNPQYFFLLFTYFETSNSMIREREIYWSKSIKANGRNKVSGGEYILWEN